MIEELIAELDAKVFAMIAGDPLLIGTVKPTPAPSLTADRWNAMCRDFYTEGRIIPGKAVVNFQATLTPDGESWVAGFRIVEVQPAPVYSQARTHRRRRVNKKWLKRYGLKRTGWGYFLKGRVVVDEVNNVIYCHPETAEKLRVELSKPQVICLNCGKSFTVEQATHNTSITVIGQSDPLSIIDSQQGPAAGGYDCPDCGAVNLVQRVVGGGWHVVLVSVPGYTEPSPQQYPPNAMWR